MKTIEITIHFVISQNLANLVIARLLQMFWLMGTTIFRNFIIILTTHIINPLLPPSPLFGPWLLMSHLNDLTTKRGQPRCFLP